MATAIDDRQELLEQFQTEQQQPFHAVFVKEEMVEVVHEDMNEPTTVKRKSITLNDKCEILAKIDAGISPTILAKQYGISKSTISGIKKHREDILKTKEALANCGGNMLKKRHRRAEDTTHEKHLYEWYVQHRAMGYNVTGPMLKRKALEFHKRLYGNDNFKASGGWLQRFKIRHCIQNFSSKDDKTSTNPSTGKAFGKEVMNLMNVSGIGADFVYNCDETVLYWKIKPNEVDQLKDEITVNRKKPKNRVAILLCANASGSHKITPFVIGKSQNPKCLRFEGKLSVEYSSHPLACMDKDRMLLWYRSVFLPEIKEKHGLSEDGRTKVILIMDNAVYNPSADKFNSICDFCTVIFLPPNIPSSVLPLNQGVIEKFKRAYRKILLEMFLVHKSSTLSDGYFETMSLLDCCNLCASAWRGITSNDVQHCWKNLVDFETFPAMENIDVETIHRIALSAISPIRDISLDSISDWLRIDANVSGWELSTNDETFAGQKNEFTFEELDDVVNPRDEPLDESRSESEFAKAESCTASEALCAIRKFQSWYRQQADCCREKMIHLQELEQRTIKAIISETD